MTNASQSLVTAAVGLGSNLRSERGGRRFHLRGAITSLRAANGVAWVIASDPIETEPVGPAAQGPYLNGAALVRTHLSPRALLELLLAIERSFGRTRDPSVRWGPRTLDLDLLLYGDVAIDEAGLTIPHPSMADRDFVLRPLAAIAPDLIHPILGRSIRDLAIAATDG